MKKTVYMLTLLLLGITSMGDGFSQLSLTIATEGPDYYADGTAVQVGETYLLVHVKKGAAFAGINTDGTLVDSENNSVVTKSLAVEGSRCGFASVQYPPQMYSAGGHFLIVMLDTRNSAGVVGGLVSHLGTSETDAATLGSSKPNSIGVTATTAGGTPALVADQRSRVSGDTPQPIISAMKGRGEKVSLTIANVSNTAVYELQTTTDLSSGQWVPASLVECANLQVASAGEIVIPATVKIPQSDKVRFFRVIVPNSN